MALAVAGGVAWLAVDSDGADRSSADSRNPPAVAASDDLEQALRRFTDTPICAEDDEPLPFAPASGEVLLGAFVVKDGCLTTYYEAVAASDAGQRLQELEADEATVSAMVDQVAFTSSTAGVDRSAEQWSLSRLRLHEAWRWTRGEGVRVGVVDTAVDVVHEDLNSNVVATRSHGRLPDSHGTHVAGIVVAAANGTGVTGVAPEADLVAVAGLQLPDLPTLVSGALGIRRAVDEGSRVINLSWFAPEVEGFSYGPLEVALRYAATKDVVIVMAAGNCGQAVDATPKCPQGISTIYTPQRWVYDDQPWTAGMLVTGSTTSSDQLSGFSSYAREPSLVGPGSSILSTVPGNGYELKDGTSMAAPAVSGVAALVRAARPDLSASEVADLLIATAQPLDGVVPGAAGAGLVDPVTALRESAGPAPFTEDYVRSMTLPGHICNYLDLPDEPRQLVNGEWHGNAVDGPEMSIYVSSLAVGDLDGDAVADAVVGVMCANGVADRTSDVYAVLGDGQFTPIGLTVDDESLEPFDPDRESLADVTGLNIDEGSLVVDMLWTFTNDALCCATTTATGTYRLDGDSFARVGVEVLSDKTRTERLAAALNGGDQVAIDTLMSPEWQTVFDADVAAGATFTPGDCAISNPIAQYRWCDLTSSEQPYPYLIYWEGGPDQPGQLGARRAHIEIVEGD